MDRGNIASAVGRRGNEGPYSTQNAMSAHTIRVASISSRIIETSYKLVDTKGLELLIVGDHPHDCSPGEWLLPTC